MIAGHWYSGSGEADVNTAFLTAHRRARWETRYTLTSGEQASVTVGSPGRSSTPAAAIAGMHRQPSTLAALDPGLAPDQYDVALKPGTNAQAYANTVGAALGRDYDVSSQRQQHDAVLRHHRPDRRR